MTFPKSTSENDPTTETVGEGFGTAVKREDDDDTGGGRGGGGRRGHLRRRRHPYFHVSPCGRGLGLAGVILLWICYAALFGGESEKDYRGSNNNKDGTVRTLLELDLSEPVVHLPGEIPTNESCVLPAITQFPSPLGMDKSTRQHGAVIIHIVLAIYMFTGLAVVCDDFFVPALEKISEELNLPPDVAGATFMAAGSSGPELATALIGVFVAEDDIGISGVIGSAVFNITLVIAVCALAATKVLYLSWWAVVRDCTCYLLSIVVLLITIANGQVSWYEALFFLILYAVYCVGMAFNSQIEALVKSKVTVPTSWSSAGATAADPDGGDAETGYGEMGGGADKGKGNAMEMKSRGGADGMTDINISSPLAQDPRAPEMHDAPEVEDPLAKPTEGGPLAKAKWAFLYPLYLLAKYTIPDCRKPEMARFYVATFISAIVWISLYSYMMVWMITVIGFTFGIPDTVMGLTFIAAGVSVPDALAGVAVVREGHGDMAVSNAIGSNVFDILVCLGIPWFIKTAITSPGSTVSVTSKGLFYSTFSLFSTVVFLIVASHFNGWKLDKKYGIILLTWYFIFMIFASLYELNVFGNFNPPECASGI